MSHEISIQNGIEEAFFANAPAWHRLGQVVNGTQSSEEAIRLAHLDWDVEKRPFYVEHNGDMKPTKVIGTVRSDTGGVLGVVSKKYKIIQNLEAFKFIDNLIYTGDMQYESAGALKGGEYVWLLAKFPEDFKLTDEDIHRKYILLLNSHNAKKQFRILPTDIRVVCWNTLNLALRMSDMNFLISHKGNIQNKLDDCRKALGILDNINQQVNDIFKQMADKKVYEEQLTRYIEQLFPYPKEDNIEEEGQRHPRIDNMRNAIVENFYSPDTTASSGNVYGLFNATTKFLDHQWGVNRDEEKRTESLLLRKGSMIKNKSYELCKELAIG